MISRLLPKGTGSSVSKAWLMYSELVGDFSDGRISGRCLTSQALSITLEMRQPDNWRGRENAHFRSELLSWESLTGSIKHD